MQSVISTASLISTHENLGDLFALVVRAGRSGDWVTGDKVGETFAIALDVHLRHEETVQFPRYQATSLEAAEEVEHFVEEHGKIRRRVGRLLANLRLNRFDEGVAEEIVHLLRQHDAREGRRFQPWLSSFGLSAG